MGLPWQSVAPVRKSFFDSHPGPIVFAKPAPALLGHFRPRIVRQNAAQLGVPLTERQAREISTALTYAGLHEWLCDDVMHVDIPRHELSPLARELLRKARTQPPVLLELPMLRGAVLSDRSEWWQAFNYRFSGGSARAGVNLNIRNRLRNSRATLVSHTGWLVLESPPPFASAGEIRSATVAAR